MASIEDNLHGSCCLIGCAMSRLLLAKNNEPAALGIVSSNFTRDQLKCRRFTEKGIMCWIKLCTIRFNELHSANVPFDIAFTLES